MSNPIPVFIAALHLTKLSFTHPFKYKAWSRSWYGPNSPLFPPCCWNYYLYINLMHFSAHFTGPYRCGAVISSSFPPFLTPCLFPPVFPSNPFSHPPPTQTTTKYPPTPTISLNASTHQPPPPSHHFIPLHTSCMPISPNPSYTTHNASPSSLIF